MSQLGPQTEIQEITKFVDDVQPETYEKPMMSTPTNWTSMAEDSKLHDIYAILQRPVRVYDSEFITSFTNVNLKFPDVILQRSPNVVSKLNYFTYFRANVKIKLMFNATPFMSGKYWMFFAPFEAVSNRPARLTDLPNVTGYPGTEIDLASGAPVELKIPYCAPLSHYNLLDTHSNMGELYVIPLNPIQTSLGSIPIGSGAPFTIFAWFEDIELALPTSLPVTVPAVREEEFFEAQISEEAGATSGPRVSGVASGLASAMSTVGAALPRLGPWVRPVEWVARAIGGAAEAVGWNKPVTLDKNCAFANIPAKGYTNMTGIDMSSKLCASPDNGLTYDAGLFSTDVDEMDIKYVTKKSCIFRSAITWNTTQTLGTQLHANAVTPGLALGPATALSPTTLAFVASMFRYWRGSLKFRLTVAKTAFHSGRLRITYHPGVYQYSIAKTNQNAYNWILDLSVASELEFEIPYVANVPWKEVIVTAFNDSVNLDKEKFSTGHITVDVLTPLRAATDTVATNCPINMWISAGDDISFAIPDFGDYIIDDDATQADPLEVMEAFEAQSAKPPYRPKDKQYDHQHQGLTFGKRVEHGHKCDVCGKHYSHTHSIKTFEQSVRFGQTCSDCIRFDAQIFNFTAKGVEHNDQTTDSAAQTFPMSNMSYTKAEELTMGEKITNLRQLIKRFTPTVEFPIPREVSNAQGFPYVGYLPLGNDNFLFNQITIDPADFGTKSNGSVVTYQTQSLPAARTLTGLVNESPFIVAKYYPNSNPLHYISNLYRFYRGGRRYKYVSEARNDAFPSSFGLRPAVAASTNPTAYTQVGDSVSYENKRTSDPMIVFRDWQILENGDIEPPFLGTFTTTRHFPAFEHLVYPDLNGVIEFEVPYYSQLPISLVGELIQNTEGPLMRRSLINLRMSHDPKGMDKPNYDYPNSSLGPVSFNRGGIRPTFPPGLLYEAAADDFSFGYLVGAPKIGRLTAQP
jgi:hypothetical protein